MINKETSEDITVYEIEEKVDDLYLSTLNRFHIASLILSYLIIVLFSSLLGIRIIVFVKDPTGWNIVYCIILAMIVSANIYTHIRETSYLYYKVAKLRNNVCKFVDQETCTVKEIEE